MGGDDGVENLGGICCVCGDVGGDRGRLATVTGIEAWTDMAPWAGENGGDIVSAVGLSLMGV